MKSFKSIISRYAVNAFAAVALVASATSCEKIDDGQGDCDPQYYVKYVYDMNMKYADAFSSQVNSVDLFVFDTNGNFVKKFSDAGSALSEAGYRMPVDLQPGNYEFIAWCGLANNDSHFTVPEQITKKSDLKCTMARKYDGSGLAWQDANLKALYHGKITANLPNAEGEHTVTVKLVKNTNNINISMQQVTGEPLNHSEFTISMGDQNGLMAHDNQLMADENITYRPWNFRSAFVDMGNSQTQSRAQEPNFIQAELATARLTPSNNPVINITHNATGKTVFSIPVTQWALMFKSANYDSMDDQEYLDREDEYNLMLFLSQKPQEDNPEEPDDEYGWTAVQVVINGWHIIENGQLTL